MNTISSTSNPVTQTSTTSETGATSSTDQTTETGTATESTTQSASTNSGTSVSSRAESLATLNSEFNIMSSDFRITQQFMNRMAELNLISGEDAERISTGLPAGDSSEQAPTVAEMQTFVSDYITELEDAEDAPAGLLDILKNAESILKDLDSSNPDPDIDIAGTAAALKQFIESEEGLANDENKDRDLRQLHNMLVVADSLSPANRNSEGVNAYIKVMQGL